MRPWVLTVVCTFACSGCTTFSLERHTLAQTDSAVDLRLKQTMQDLALVADNPSALPVYASIYAGSAVITDTASLGSTTVWQYVVALDPQNGFASQGANPGLSRNVGQNWTLDPIVDPEKLEAMRCCFRFAVYGQDGLQGDCASLLARPDQVPGVPGRHFGVLDDLGHLPTGWLCRGKLKDVPLTCRYKAHHGHTWVWVSQGGIKGLTDFSLIIQNIARVNINSPTLYSPGLNPAPASFPLAGKVMPEITVDDDLKDKGARVIKLARTPNPELLKLGDVIVGIIYDIPTDDPKNPLKKHLKVTGADSYNSVVQGIPANTVGIQLVLRNNMVLPVKLTPVKAPGFLDVNVAADDKGVRIISMRDAGKELTDKLQVNDVILQVLNSKGLVVWTANPNDPLPVVTFNKAIQQLNPKETATLQRERGGVEVPVAVAIGSTPPFTAAVSLARDGTLSPDVPYYRTRLDSQGSEPDLRSQISAAIVGAK